MIIESEGVRKAQRMLWHDPRVSLAGKPEALVPEEVIARALRQPLPGKAHDERDLAIRECFDSVLARLQRLNQHVQKRLLTAEDVAVYLQYTCELLLGKRPEDNRSEEVTSAIEEYHRAQGFDGALDFARRIAERR